MRRVNRKRRILKAMVCKEEMDIVCDKTYYLERRMDSKARRGPGKLFNASNDKWRYITRN